jgi:1,4-dihydroxy-2-naphthoyl-CoA hydrolase
MAQHFPAEDPATASGRHAPFDPAVLIDRGVMGLLDISVRSASADEVVLSMEVTPKTHQPFGVLHGGVSALLAETAASLGGALAAGPERSAVGVELNASHLRAMSQGTLIATARPLRKGRTLQVWDVSLVDDADRPICHARCTLAVIEARRS